MAEIAPEINKSPGKLTYSYSHEDGGRSLYYVYEGGIKIGHVLSDGKQGALAKLIVVLNEGYNGLQTEENIKRNFKSS